MYLWTAYLEICVFVFKMIKTSEVYPHYTYSNQYFYHWLWSSSIAANFVSYSVLFNIIYLTLEFKKTLYLLTRGFVHFCVFYSKLMHFSRSVYYWVSRLFTTGFGFIISCLKFFPFQRYI